MSMREYYDTGYSPVPFDSAGRPRVGGVAVGIWRFNPLTHDEVFPNCAIGLQCCERPLTGGLHWCFSARFSVRLKNGGAKKP